MLSVSGYLSELNVASRTEIGAVLYTKFMEVHFSVGVGFMAALAASSFLPALLTVRSDTRDAVPPEPRDFRLLETNAFSG